MKNSLPAIGINEDRSLIGSRVKELEKGNALGYPRIQKQKHTLTLEEYQLRYRDMVAGEKRSSDVITVCGMF